MAIRVGMLSLGCTKNLVDSEVMLGLLKENGYEITSREEDADILIVNTCAFIDAAKQESMDTIFDLVDANNNGHRKIIIAGCLAQRYGDQLREELGDSIHALLGTGDFHHIIDACETVLSGKRIFSRVSKKPTYLYDHDSPRLRATQPHLAYVKIAEGCDNKCSYCVIPQVRGRYRSRRMQSIVAEVSSLVGSGVREVNLIAQDTTYYGRDLKDGADLTSLLRNLLQIPNIGWIRILYGHPDHISDELLNLMASEDRICSYIDIPIQHIHGEILRKMGRHTTESQIRRIIFKIRDIVPDIALRTSLIVGFPGETEGHFNALVQFIEQAQFDHLGVFAYSAEEGTKAARLGNRVPESVKEQRVDQIAQIHEEISMKKRRDLIGEQKVVLVESIEPETVGRTQGQAPDIDDIVYIADENVKIGNFVNVEIMDTCGPYDLIGRVVT